MFKRLILAVTLAMVGCGGGKKHHSDGTIDLSGKYTADINFTLNGNSDTYTGIQFWVGQYADVVSYWGVAEKAGSDGAKTAYDYYSDDPYFGLTLHYQWRGEATADSGTLKLNLVYYYYGTTTQIGEDKYEYVFSNIQEVSTDSSFAQALVLSPATLPSVERRAEIGSR